MCNHIILDKNKNLIHEKKCKYCNKWSQYYRHGTNDYTCKEHLFDRKPIKHNVKQKVKNDSIK